MDSSTLSGKLYLEVRLPNSCCVRFKNPSLAIAIEVTTLNPVQVVKYSFQNNPPRVVFVRYRAKRVVGPPSILSKSYQYV